MSKLTIPKHIQQTRVELIREPLADGNTLCVDVVPSWPCYAKDGAGAITYLSLEQYILLPNGSRFFIYEKPIL